MIKKYTIIASLVALALFTGCIDTETVVKLKKDGSGEIRETLIMGKMIVEMVKSMQASFDSTGGDSPLFKEDELKENAKSIGEGVEFVSVEPFTNEKGEGYTALYTFKDINKLKINQNPGDKVKKEGEKQKTVKEFVTFEFIKGNPATLKIRMPKDKNKDKKKKEKKEEKGKKADKVMDNDSLNMVMQQMTSMFSGMRMALMIEIDGEIVETNATHREKQKITLFEMDWEKLMQDKDTFIEFSKLNPQTVEESKDLLKNVKGMKIDLNEEVVVKFK